MSRPVRSAHELQAEVEAVHAALTGEQWPAALDVRLRDGSRLVERTALPDGGVRVVVRRNLPQGIPGPLQRFAPSDGAVTQTDEWGPAHDGARTGTWSVEFAGAPGTLSGTTRLEPVEAGTRWTVEGAVEVRIPLVGGQAERFLAPLVESLVDKQAEVLRTLV